ncbi:unnamed protein product [Bemisia tabaci]|uniref:Ionotropic receptor n=1 Tax=Bemisia tabaci TaxID=7038 RepID=A0A9P0EXY8_BEMTA|nr:unnamed protein product [Bemisia tabaci]
MEYRWESATSLVFNVCREIADRTELRLFYIVELDSDPSLKQIPQSFHDISIQTISISHQSEISGSVLTEHSKNMIFSVDDIGHKAIICLPDGCTRYDPFTENLISYQHRDRTDDAFFEFSWKNMHKKPLKILADFSQSKPLKVSARPTWSSWYIFQEIVLSHQRALLTSHVPGDRLFEGLGKVPAFIQTFEQDKLETLSLLDELNYSQELKGRLTDNLRFYVNYISNVIFSDERCIDALNETESPSEIFPAVKEIFGDLLEEAEENVRSMAEADSLLLSLPSSFASKENLRVKHLFKNQWVEYHLMDEYIMTHPVIILFLKNSFYFEKYNQMITRFLESGIARRILEAGGAGFLDTERLEVSTVDELDKAPRAFTVINDLQSAFIGLIIGLFLSFLAFVGEICVDFCRHSGAVKYLMRLKISLLKKI